MLKPINKFIIFFLVLLLLVSLNYSFNVQKQKNILFISIDDLRPELGCYGKDHIFSPNIDYLASNSFLFENAVCNVPVCGASRASLMTGLRPNKNRFLNFKSRADIDADSIPTLAEWLRINGYYTISNGKIFHKLNDSPESWSEKAWRPKKDFRDYLNKKNIEIAQNNNGNGPAFEVGINTIKKYSDTKVLEKSIKDLNRLKKIEKPFFLAVGFSKPHLPFNAPKKYWDLYEGSKIKLAENRYAPINAPKESLHQFGELRKYHEIPSQNFEIIPDSTQRKLIHGYYACVSYVDDLVGQLLNHLKEINLYENTIIILWGDHGWQLGEHNLWAKHSNYQTSLKVPLIIYNNKNEHGIIKQQAELVDLYPTICEMVNIKKPEFLNGRSLLPIMKNQENKNESFSRFHDAVSVTTEKYSYTEWRAKKTDSVYAKMLYDLEVDPNENTNISGNEKLLDIQIELSKKIDSLVLINN